jgi:hypothetical protein
MSDHIINFYETIPKKYLQTDQTYPNFNKTNIRLPMRVIMYGPPGSGKTNCLLNWIYQMGAFAEYYVCARNTDQPLYQSFFDIIRALEKKLKRQLLFVCHEPAEMPDLDTLTNDGNHKLFIYDDQLSSTTREYAMMEKPFIMGRNLGVSVVFLSQSWSGIARTIRISCDYVVVLKLNSQDDIKRIIRDASLDIKPEQLLTMYTEATTTMNSFFLIDKVTNDPALKFRRNFARTLELPLVSTNKSDEPSQTATSL